MKRGVLAAALLAVAACSGQPDEAEVADPSKLSEDLEARAKEIEARADEAVREVEAQAEDDITAAAEVEDREDGDEAAEAAR